MKQKALVIIVFIFSSSSVIAQSRISAEILHRTPLVKYIEDKTQDGSFNNASKVFEAWYLLKLKPMKFDSEFRLKYDSVIISIDLEFTLLYLERKEEFKQLHERILKEKSVSTVIFFENSKEVIDIEKWQYLSDQLNFLVEEVLKRGEAIILDKNGVEQSEFYFTTYETNFSSGVNFYLNNRDSTFIFHRNHLVK